MALLGRISAVLTANTQDFTRQIGTARREIQDFARQARGVQFNLNTRSLDGTLTQLQRFQRTIREIQQLQARGVDAGLPNANRLRDQFRAFEDIGRPLTAVKNQIEGLSNSVQAELYPALERAQAGFRNFYSELETGATTFDRSAARVENLQRRITALGRATAAAGDFSNLAKSLNANTAGASFFQPRARESLQRSLELRNEAQKVPARFRGGVFADLAVEAERGADEIERAAARVAAAQLRIAERGETPANLVRRGRAQAELDNLTTRQNAINASFQRELTSTQIQQVVSPEAERQVDSLIERFAKLSAKLREGNDTRFENLIASVGRVVEQLNRGEISAKRAKVAIEALAGADFAKSFGAAGFEKATKSLKTDSEQALDEIRKNFNAQRKNVIANVGALGLIGPDRTRRIGEINTQEDIARARVGFNSNVLESVSSLDTKTKQLDNAGLRSQFENIRKLAIDANSSLNAAFNAKPEDASAALDNYNLKLSALNKTLDNFQQKVSSAETAQKRFSQFLSISGSRSDKLGSSLSRFATDIAATRQLAGNLPASNVSGRAAIERRIEKDIQFAEKIANAQQRVSDNRRISENERSRRRRLIDDTVARRRAESVDVLVDNSGGTITKQRAQSVMDRFAKNQGSISVAGAASAQLALQQGLFAVDDFISSTGGIEYKLRAIGNNITQLGLLLGQSGLIPGLSATTGLFIGLAAVMGGQLASAFARFISDSETTEQKIKVLNSATSAHESGVKKLADAYRALADEIRSVGQSDLGRQRSQIDEKVRELAGDRTASREALASSTDPGIVKIRAKRSVLENQLEKEDNITDRVRIQRQIERTKRQERGALSTLSSEASGDSAAAAISGAALGAVAQARRAIDAAENPFARKDESIIQDARESLASIQVAMKDFAAFPKFDVNNTAQAGKALEAIQKQLAALDELRESPAVATADGIVSAIDTIAERLLKEAARIEARLSGAFTRVDEQLTRSSYKAAQALAESGKIIGDAFGEAISSSSIQAELDRLSDALGQVRELAGNAATPDEAAAYQADINAINDHANQLKAASTATRFFADALSEIFGTFDSDNSAFRQRMEDARRADIEFSTPETASRRSRAEADFANAAIRRRGMEDYIASAREREEQRQKNDPAARARSERINEINQRLSVPADETSPEGIRGGTPQFRDEMRAERERLMQQQESEVNNSLRVRTARKFADDEANRLMKVQSVDRGRELMVTPAGKAGKELARNLRDLDEAFKRDGVGQAKQDETNKRLIDDAMRQTAPAIFNMADEVMNAVVQGPSRAALQASDITTSQGAAELNRLLRGDDSAKNQNLVELQKQSTALTELVTIARENGAPPGVFDN